MLNLRKTVCTTMATVLALSAMAMPAMAAVQEGNVSAPNTVVNPIFSVGVPKTVGFALNPMKVGNGAQVVAGDFEFVNNSNVIAAIDVSVMVTGAKGVTLYETPDSDTKIKNEAGYTEKDAALLLKYGTAVTGAGTDSKAYTYTAADATESTEVTLNHSIDFSIVLGAGTAPVDSKVATADTTMGYASFTFDGEINPNAVWLAKDLTVTTIYRANSLTAEAAVAAYDGGGTAFADDAPATDLGLQIFDVNPWKTEHRTYGFAATVEAGEIPLAAAASGYAAEYFSDAACTRSASPKLAFDASSYDKFTFNAKDSGLKPGASATYYAKLTKADSADIIVPITVNILQ